MLSVFRDITLDQLTAMFLYETSKLLKEEAVERVFVSSLLFTVCVRSSSYVFLCIDVGVYETYDAG